MWPGTGGSSILRQVRHVGDAGNLQAVVVAFTAQGAKAIVQRKRYLTSKNVTSPDIQMFIGMAHRAHNATKLIYMIRVKDTRNAQLDFVKDQEHEDQPSGSL